MKKISIVFYILITCVYLVSCNVSEQKELTKEMLYSDWYNCAKLPSMEDPFAEAYDGSYSIKIEENNNVLFITSNNEAFNGKLELLEEEAKKEFTIVFENEEKATCFLSLSNDIPYLRVYFRGLHYCFSKSKVLSKEEFEQYRYNFNKFLTDSFMNDSYPTLQEAENDPLYREYTNFVHIDPCCNGPKRYVSVEKVLITSEAENDNFTVVYSSGREDTISRSDLYKIVLVKSDGTFESLENICAGQCFLAENNFLYYFENIESNNLN